MTIYKETGLHRHPDGKEGKDFLSATHLALLCLGVGVCLF